MPCSLTRCYAPCHLVPALCVRTPQRLAPVRPLASRPCAHCTSVLRVVAHATHARSCARCPTLLAPMLLRTPCCRAPTNAPALLCFRADHKHAYILPRLGTRSQAKPRHASWPPMTHGGDKPPPPKMHDILVGEVTSSALTSPTQSHIKAN